MTTLPSQEVLQSLLEYVPETGELFWKERPREMFTSFRYWKQWNNRYAGQEAFTSVDTYGYEQGSIFRRRFLKHRVIWKLITGEDARDIDHINGNRSDNTWGNLREVDRRTNSQNTRRRVTNRSGVQGVCWNKSAKKFQAQITLSGKQKYLGLFDTLEEAAAARKAAEQQYGFHENHGRVL